MRVVLFVMHVQVRDIPSGYTQEKIAMVRTDAVLDIVTAKNKCERFFPDTAGTKAMVPRVGERILVVNPDDSE